MEILEAVKIEGVFNPEAIKDYYFLEGNDNNNKGVRDYQLKAKQHLSAVGWTFHYVKKKDKNGADGYKRDLRYCPPVGRKYISLKTACKAYLDQQNQDSGVVGGGLCDLPQKRGDFLDSLSFKGEENKWVGTEVGVDSNGAKSGDFVGVDDLSQKEGIVLQSKENGDRIMGKKRQLDELGEGVRVGSEIKRNKSTLYWLIEHKVIVANAKVQYRNKIDGRSMMNGRATREGILCDCCDRVFTISKFEAHAGSNYHRPTANIFFEDGKSLAQYQQQLKCGGGDDEGFETKSVSLKQHLKGDEGFKTKKLRQNQQLKGEKSSVTRKLKQNQNKYMNDEICSVCLFDGELILCNLCPSAFHVQCLGMRTTPDSKFWFCPSCCCRICHQNKGINKKGKSIRCEQCETLCHVQCLTESYGEAWSEKNGRFCNQKCEDVFIGLHKFLGKPFVVGDTNLTCTLLRNENNEGGHLENHRKLKDALGVMHERFNPVKEPWTGTDVITDVIFSRESEFKRLNFRGFYTMILERDGEVITVAAIRILGEKVAEVPLVATRSSCEKRGMCKILMCQLENKLMKIGVEILVLHSLLHTLKTWTSPSFQFCKSTNYDRAMFLNYTFLEFPGTIRCQKRLVKK